MSNTATTIEQPGASSQDREEISMVDSLAIPRSKKMGAVCANTRLNPSTYKWQGTCLEVNIFRGASQGAQSKLQQL